jgi:phosphate transport system substrate-binding protein
MRLFSKTVAVAVGAVGAAVASLALALPAHADTAARTGDVVGVGSDTVQNMADFLFDGAPGVAGGYNNVGNNNRVENVFATGDANGRLPYDGTCGTPNPATTGLGTFCDSTTNLAPNALAGSVILRVGTAPVTRPNGSGQGVAALIADSASPGYQGLPAGSINFARMSRLPNATEETNCTNITACGGLHVYQAATDQLTIAHQASAYNGPAGLTADQLYHIFVLCDYATWNQIPGNTTGSTDTIHPIIPQSGSGTRNFFLADLQAAEGLPNPPAPGPCTRIAEEHDPTGIYQDPTPADAIEPFSSGKIAMINSGYLKNAGYTNAAGNNAFTPGFLSTLTGAPPGGGTTYNSTRGLYFTLRQTDVTSTKPFQSGTSQTFAQVLFSLPTSLIARASNAPLVAAAGFTQAYKDCGINPTSC